MVTRDANMKKSITNAFFYSTKSFPALSHATTREEFDKIKTAIGEKFGDSLKDFDYMAERVWEGLVHPRILSNFVTEVNWKK